MDFKELLRLLRRRWKSIMAMLVIAIGLSALFSFTATPVYHSTARVFISTDVSNSSEAYFAGVFGQQRVQSYADLATSGEVMSKVIKRLDLNLTPQELASKISASVAANTVIITLDVTDPSARMAQQIAQAEAEELTQYVTQVETPAGKNTTPVKATITDKATFNGSPVSPRTALNLLVGAVLGLLLGFAVALVRDLLDTTVKTPEDITQVSAAPVMAHVAFDSALPKAPLLTDLGINSARAEAFRLLRTNLQFLDLDAEPKSFVITSSVPGEGKTSTSTGLAIALAQAGKRVLLVDGDLRRPRIAKLLGLEASVGLTTLLVGRSDLEASIQRHDASGLHFLASGPIPPNPTEVLQSRATRDLLRLLRNMYDVVVIDTPPLLPVADAAIMAKNADGAIIVVRHGKTTREQLRHAHDRIEQVGGRLFGFVVNMTPRRGAASYGYEYGYGYAPLETKTAG